MTFNLRLSRARTGVVAMRQDSSYYNNWIPRNWGEKGVKFKKIILIISLILLMGPLMAATMQPWLQPSN